MTKISRYGIIKQIQAEFLPILKGKLKWLLLKWKTAIDSQGLKSSSLSGLEGENMLLAQAVRLQK